MGIILWLAVSLLLLMLVSGAYIFCVACCRGKEINYLDAQAVSDSPYADYYSQIVSADRWLKDHGCQDVFINSHDGIRLHGLWINAENAKGTVILFHGYRSTYLVDFSMAFEFYHNAGYNLLIPNQRAHGKSGGKYITFGIKESEDVLSWIAFHNRNFGLIPVVLNGLSMGASTVLFTANMELPNNVCGIIADCGFTSPKEIVATVYRRVIHLPPVLSMWAVNIFSHIFAGVGLGDKDTRISLANSKVPVLMIHGKNDGFVPCKMSEIGYEACIGKKKLFLVDGADHGVSFVKDRDGYIREVVSFLEENVDPY